MARRPLSALRRARRSPLVPSVRDLAAFAATMLVAAACVTWMPVPAQEARSEATGKPASYLPGRPS